MIYEFLLPDLGEGITEGDIVAWKTKEGDEVAEHQVIVEVETDKAIVAVPSPKKGRIAKLHYAEGDTASVGAPLVSIEVGEADAAAVKRPESTSVVGSLPDKEEILATPAVRALGKKLGVALEKLRGTGPGGRVTEADVKAVAGETKKETADKFGETERVQIKGVRKAIAKNLLLSLRNAASVTGTDDADVTGLWELKKKEDKAARERGVHLTFMPFFIKAAIHALKEHSMLNASMDEEREEVVVKKYYNIGVAVDTADGLMVPVVKDADKKTILQLAKEIQELGLKARERKITVEELKGSTFTISNYGSVGGVYATPVINYPDVAILGFGKIREMPWVREGKVEIRRILPISFTFDHRVADGVEAAAFINKVVKYLEDPGLLFIESA